MQSFSRRVAALVAGAAASLLVLTGCSVNDNPAAPSPNQSSNPTNTLPAGPVPQGFEEVYSQELDWNTCGGGAFQCATVEAPMDWSDPNSERVGIAVQMYKARSSSPQGTVLINPGGPGGSGVELVGYAPAIFGEKLLENYNILGFDPRGVGLSEPIKCLDSEAMDRHVAASYPADVTEKVLAVMQKDADAFASACKENSGPVMEFVDTQSAARDMDLIRALVGDEKLNYLGYSYGTQLGATYAGLFPANVGRAVLDGAIDLRLSSFEQTKQQAIGFENALRAFVENCQTNSDCVLTGSVDDGMEKVSTMLQSLGTNPLPTDSGRVLTKSLGFYGVAQPLYAEALWPALEAGLHDAIAAQDGSTLLELSDEYFGRDEDGNYTSNQTEAFTAINCLDTRDVEDFAAMKKESEEIVKAAPTMGEFFGWGGVTCKNWPFPQAEQNFDLSAAGADPIMVIGTTNDPATPYVWAQGLAEQLDSGFLVTHEGEGHTAYGMGNQCITDVVDSYFVDGTVPSEGKTC